jgi:hypothetical protein
MASDAACTRQNVLHAPTERMVEGHARIVALVMECGTVLSRSQLRFGPPRHFPGANWCSDKCCAAYYTTTKEDT